MAASNTDVVGELLQAWNAHDLQRVVSFYASDYLGMDVGQSGTQHGPFGRAAVLAHYIQAFPDIQWIGDCIAQGSMVALVWTMRGTHGGTLMRIPATGKQVEVKGVSILTVRDGKIIHGQDIWDTGGLLRALGLLPDLA